MLVLSRKVGETIWIGEDIEIVISEVKGEQVKIGIRAPRSIDVIRGELRQDVSVSNTEAVIKNLALLKAPKNK
ncbi:carbon storage regulator [Lysinibacillus composti]|uniref:Translational regulator CsrA n=1 Tax=Lysinibacillus composti TaxID=720633 RepID=A0A3N9UH75_9BACI|nr:carbon storage regulator CsrA [Lysinibacillus composti]MBM7607970.1 carbon storage regulator [Lysinibacillus composti]RQW75431.1 carbon storage regulator [Lysinibacillus composti]